MSATEAEKVSAIALPTARSLETFVRQTLCERDRLDAARTPFFRAEVVRAGKPMGMLYTVEGPRSLRLSAIWAEAEHRILFYDPNGTRWLEVRLTESPSVEEIEIGSL